MALAAVAAILTIALGLVRAAKPQDVVLARV
jgi:hypothetical protein